MYLNAGDKVFFPRNYDGKYKIRSGTLIGKDEEDARYWHIRIPRETFWYAGECLSTDIACLKAELIFRTALEAMDKAADLLKQDYADAHKKMLEDQENWLSEHQKAWACNMQMSESKFKIGDEVYVVAKYYDRNYILIKGKIIRIYSDIVQPEKRFKIETQVGCVESRERYMFFTNDILEEYSGENLK